MLLAPLLGIVALAASALAAPADQITPNVSKWSATRDDLLARDAACAASDRARNAASHHKECSGSAVADLTQVDALRTQMLDAADHALSGGELDRRDVRRLRRLAAKIRHLPARQTGKTAGRYHAKAAALGRACRLLSSEAER